MSVGVTRILHGKYCFICQVFQLEKDLAEALKAAGLPPVIPKDATPRDLSMHTTQPIRPQIFKTIAPEDLLELSETEDLSSPEFSPGELPHMLLNASCNFYWFRWKIMYLSKLIPGGGGFPTQESDKVHVTFDVLYGRFMHLSKLILGTLRTLTWNCLTIQGILTTFYFYVVIDDASVLSQCCFALILSIRVPLSSQ